MGMGARLADVAVHVGSLVVEPTFLARVSKATWEHPNREMAVFGKRARGSHPSFHVASRHGFELVFRKTAEGDRLVVPADCR